MNGSENTPAARMLRAEGLVKRYKKRTVVQSVNVEVRQGEVVGLLGPNGAGKTTTFYMIVGMIRPDSGSVFLDQTEITTMAMYKRARMGIGYLPQEASIFRKMSVEENLMAVLQLMDMPGEKRKRRCEELMTDFNITHLARSKGYMLSGVSGAAQRSHGPWRRIRASSCWTNRSRGSIRSRSKRSCASWRTLKTKNIGVLVTDHNVHETLSITDRAYLLFEGQILKAGTAEYLASDPEARKIYLGENFKLDRYE